MSSGHFPGPGIEPGPAASKAAVRSATLTGITLARSRTWSATFGGSHAIRHTPRVDDSRRAWTMNVWARLSCSLAEPRPRTQRGPPERFDGLIAPDQPRIPLEGSSCHAGTGTSPGPPSRCARRPDARGNSPSRGTQRVDPGFRFGRFSRPCRTWFLLYLDTSFPSRRYRSLTWRCEVPSRFAPVRRITDDESAISHHFGGAGARGVEPLTRVLEARRSPRSTPRRIGQSREGIRRDSNPGPRGSQPRGATDATDTIKGDSGRRGIRTLTPRSGAHSLATRPGQPYPAAFRRADQSGPPGSRTPISCVQGRRLAVGPAARILGYTFGNRCSLAGPIVAFPPAGQPRSPCGLVQRRSAPRSSRQDSNLRYPVCKTGVLAARRRDGFAEGLEVAGAGVEPARTAPSERRLFPFAYPAMVESNGRSDEDSRPRCRSGRAGLMRPGRAPTLLEIGRCSRRGET